MNGFMRRTGVRVLRVGAGAALVAGTAGWGPHTRISQVAVDSLDRNNPLVRFMGGDIREIPRNAFLPDHIRHQTYDRDGNGYFRINDYLQFPGAPRRATHMPPSMYENYNPFFRRALMFLRTRSRADSARQIAALTHWIQDNGSPPHALGIYGGLHVKMEHGIGNDDIHIRGYRPRLLGSTDAAAVAGLIRRCRELEAYSTIRAKKIRYYVLIGRPRLGLPYMAECANECARATADALHTLGVRLGHDRPGTSALAWPVGGKVTATWRAADGKVHGAVDIAAAADAVAVAARRGKVLVADYGVNRGFGNYVRIGHVNGYSTDYHHFRKLLTVRGRAVECMTHIGTAGTSGTPTTPQVHFELRRFGTKVLIAAKLGERVHKGSAVPGSWPAF